MPFAGMFVREHTDLLTWLVVVAFFAPIGSNADEPAIHLDQPPVKSAEPLPLDRPPFKYDPLSPPKDELDLDSPFYKQDSLRAALDLMPADTPLGPPDIADDAWNAREERLAEISRNIGSRARHSATILGMDCDLTSLLGYVCHIPHSDCIVGVGMPLFGCAF